MSAANHNKVTAFMTDAPQDGDIRSVDNLEQVYYCGYWIRYYHPPPESLQAKKQLIEHLTKRAFHHTESGINTPGDRLELAREAYEVETDPLRRRVNAAMLAGALFNRATDIFNAIVELEEKGVHISRQNELMRECSQSFQEALSFGKQVRHHSGEEGIDELWGEPFRAFTAPIARFYEGRYIKVAQTMRDLDNIGERLKAALRTRSGWVGVSERIDDLTDAAKREAEIMRSDDDNFRVWPHFVAARERLVDFVDAAEGAAEALPLPGGTARQLVLDGILLISYLAGARVPMPKSTGEFLDRVQQFITTPSLIED